MELCVYQVWCTAVQALANYGSLKMSIEDIEDIYLLEVNTKYISSNVLKRSAISRVRNTSGIVDIFNT